MPERPVFSAEMGEYFVSLPMRKGLTQNAAAEKAKRRGIKGLSQNMLWRLETGRIKMPTREAISTLSALYEIDEQEVLQQIAVFVYGTTWALFPTARRPPLPSWTRDNRRDNGAE